MQITRCDLCHSEIEGQYFLFSSTLEHSKKKEIKKPRTAAYASHDLQRDVPFTIENYDLCQSCFDLFFALIKEKE